MEELLRFCPDQHSNCDVLAKESVRQAMEMRLDCQSNHFGYIDLFHAGCWSMLTMYEPEARSLTFFSLR